MKIKLLSLFVLSLSLCLTGCHPQSGQKTGDDVHKKVDTSACQSVTEGATAEGSHVKDGHAIAMLSGKCIQFEYTATTGAYADLQGEKMITTFDMDSQTYETRNLKGEYQSSGNYSYYSTGPDKGELILTLSSGMRELNKLELMLRFTSKTEGSFNGKLLQGAVGRQKGKFKFVSAPR